MIGPSTLRAFYCQVRVNLAAARNLASEAKDLQDKKRKRPERNKDTVKDSLKKTDNHRIPENIAKCSFSKVGI